MIYVLEIIVYDRGSDPRFHIDLSKAIRRAFQIISANISYLRRSMNALLGVFNHNCEKRLFLILRPYDAQGMPLSYACSQSFSLSLLLATNANLSSTSSRDA